MPFATKSDHSNELRRAAQRTLRSSLKRIQENWGLDALSAIPDVDGLRPISVDAVSTGMFRSLAYISSHVKDVRVFQAAILDQRKRRLETKKFLGEKDKLITVMDVRRVCERYRAGLINSLSGKAIVPSTDNDKKSKDLRRKATESQVVDDGSVRTKVSISDGTFHSSEESLSDSGTTIHSCIHVTQPQEFDTDTVLNRRKTDNDEESSRPTKRRKHSNRRVTGRGDLPFTIAVAHELPENADDAKELSTPRPWHKKITPLAAYLIIQLSKSDRRSSPYPCTPSKSVISPQSASLTEQIVNQSPTTQKDPLKHMLDKITTDFTDNLFFLHGVLRTYADADTARARASALDAAAAGVLDSMSAFRKKVKRINEEDIEPPSLEPPAGISTVRSVGSFPDYRSVPDYSPPTSTLPKNNPRALKAEWAGMPLDLSNDPDIHLLHEAEVHLASTLRLSGAAYLFYKREIFEARLQGLCVGKEFWKVNTYQVRRADVNKVITLCKAYERVGWFRKELFEQYLGSSSATPSGPERTEVENSRDVMELSEEHNQQWGEDRCTASRMLQTREEHDSRHTVPKDFRERHTKTHCQKPDSGNIGTEQGPASLTAAYKDPFEEICSNPWTTELP